MVTVEGKAVIHLEQTEDSDRIFYTTDGTEPTESSPEWTGEDLTVYNHLILNILRNTEGKFVRKSFPGVFVKLSIKDVSVQLEQGNFILDYPYKDKYSDLTLFYYGADNSLIQSFPFTQSISLPLSSYENGDYISISSEENVYPSDTRLLPKLEITDPEITYTPNPDKTSVTVTLEAVGEAIYYTLDGSEPTKENGTLYQAPFETSLPLTLKAVTTLWGAYSNITSLVLYGYIPLIELEVRSGTASDNCDIYIVNYSSFSGINIVYTDDGSTPTESSPVLASDHLNIINNGIYKFWAYQANYNPNEVSSVEVTNLKCQPVTAEFSY